MRIATSITLALTLLAAAPAAAVVQRADTVATYIGGIGDHPISGDGRRVVFSALTAGGDEEIFVWVQASGLFRITDESNQPGINNVTALDANFDGREVAAIADGDLADTGATVGELYRLSEGAPERLTFTSGPLSKVFPFDVAISDDGKRIAFSSRDDYTGENPGGDLQIFVWDEGDGFTQVTHGIPCGAGGGNFLAALSGDGHRILFESRCQYGTANDDLGIDLFLWDENAGVRALTETKGNDTGARVSLNQDGSVAALVTRDDLTLEGLGGAYRLYRWVDGEGFTLLTKEPTSSSAPSISADGSRIVYAAKNGQGTDEINPEGTEELFFWQEGLSDVAALTDSGQTDQDFGNTRPHLSADGTRLSMFALRAFDAPADLRTGHYLIDVLSPQEARPNLLVNGSFGAGLELGGWQHGPAAAFSLEDGKADPASGSVLQRNDQAGGGGAVSGISQCVPVAPSAEYVISGLLRLYSPGNSNTGSARLAVHLYPAKNCNGAFFSPLTPVQVLRADGAWIGAHGRFVTEPTTFSARVLLFTGRNEATGFIDAGFDDLNLRRDNKVKILP